MDENYDLALSYFNSAYAVDTEAKAEVALWKSLATMASTVLSPEIQTIATNAGLTNFPTTLNDMVTGDFLNGMQVLEENSDWVWNETLGYDEEIITLENMNLPAITGTDVFINLVNFDNEETNILNIQEYAVAILNNLSTAYSSGVSEPLMSLTTVLTTALANVSGYLEAVDFTSNISLTKDIMLPGATGDINLVWPTENGSPIDYVVGEAEFRTMAGALEIINSIFTYTMSVTYDVALDQLVEQLIYTLTNDGEFSTDLLFDNPMSGMWADNRETTTYLAESKALMVSGLGNLITATGLIMNRTEEVSPFNISKDALGDSLWSEIYTPLEVGKEFSTRLKAAIEVTATTLVVPLKNWDSTAVFDEYTETAFAADNITPLALEINPSVLYDQSFMDPSYILEMDADREPVIYDFGSDGSDTPAVLNSLPTYTESIYGVKGVDYTLGGFVVITESQVTNLLTSSGMDSLVQINSDKSFYVMGVLTSPIVWSTLNDMTATASTDDSVTIYGASSFYWALLRNPSLLVPDMGE